MLMQTGCLALPGLCKPGDDAVAQAMALLLNITAT